MLDSNALLLILQASSLTITLGLALLLFFAWFHQPDTSSEYEQMRWCNVAALLIMAVHYALQIGFGFRAQGADVGAVINILFYSLAIYISSYSFVRLAGRPSYRRRFVLVTSVSMFFILVCALWGYLHYRSMHMPVALYAMGATFFASILFCYFYPRREINRVRRLAYEESGQLQVQYNLFLRTASALLYGASLAMSLSIYYNPLVFIVGPLNLIAFLFFIISFIALGFNIGNVNQVISTELGSPTPAVTESVDEVKPMLSAEQREMVRTLLEDWRSKQGYNTSELNSTTLSSRLNIPKRLLIQYLREVEGKTFRIWLSDLRLAEVKHLIQTHPEYSIETIAESCGFSRSHLQAKFKESTGMTPAEWRDAQKQNG